MLILFGFVMIANAKIVQNVMFAEGKKVDQVQLEQELYVIDALSLILALYAKNIINNIYYYLSFKLIELKKI